MMLATAYIRPTLLSLAVAVACVAPARASLSLGDHPLPIEGESLGDQALFARLDSVQTLYDRAEEGRRGDLAYRLGQLYLATDLAKHRRRALDLLEEAAHAGTKRFEAASLRAATAHRMRYTGDALRWIEDLAATNGDDARAYTLLGRFHYLEARRRMDTERFELARRSFVRAVQADNTNVEAWYGVAVSAVALRDHDLALRAAHALGQLEPQAESSLFLEGLASYGLDDMDGATRAFTEALDRSDPAVAAVFEAASGFLDAVDLARLAERRFPRQMARRALQRIGEEARPGEEIDWEKALTDSTLRAETVQFYWNQQNDRPAQIFNPQRLRYWARLVEADVLFGDPETGLRGWDTPMGDALVRWGRPEKTYYDSGGPGSVLSDLSARGFRFSPGETIPTNVPIWVWGYEERGFAFSLVFTDESRNARWTYGTDSAYNAQVIRRQQPIHLPQPPDPPTPFRLAVSRAVFPRGDDSAVLETYIGLRPSDQLVLASSIDPSENGGEGVDSLATIEWAVYDEQNRRLDYRKEVVDDEMRRDLLHDRVGWSGTGDVLDPYVVPIGARLPAGRYRVAVEATGPDGAGRDALTLDVEIPPSEPPSILEMSDLQLASALDVFRPGSGVPLRYVKFRQAVIPAPDLRVPAASKSIAVYFEVRNLGLDEAGLTRFDVTYEVFASSREVRNLTVLSEDFRRDALERIEPMTMTFLEERTGTSPEGLVVKGTRVDVADLGAGDYVLVVTLRDRISKREVSRVLPFRKRGS